MQHRNFNVKNPASKNQRQKFNVEIEVHIFSAFFKMHHACALRIWGFWAACFNAVVGRQAGRGVNLTLISQPAAGNTASGAAQRAARAARALRARFGGWGAAGMGEGVLEISPHPARRRFRTRLALFLIFFVAA